VAPDIKEIAAKLNQTPAVSSSYNYEKEMIDLADQDSQREQKKQAIIGEIEQLRRKKQEQEEREHQEREKQQQKEKEQKLTQVQEIIEQAQEIFNKSGATKTEVEKAVKDLRGLKEAATNSAEKEV
jgi:hypothetical protein